VDGRYADFHSLRHGYTTMIGKAGVSPKEHQDLARHSTYALTARYTHSRFYDLAAAVNSLPSFAPAGPGVQPLAATGTDGKPLGPFLGPQSEKTGDKAGQTGAEAARVRETKNPGKHAVFAVFRGSGRDGQNVEAPGIEPGSRGTEAPASTCVSCLVLIGRSLAAPPTAFARAAPDKQGPVRANR